MAGRAILAFVPDLMFSVRLREAAARALDTLSTVDSAGDFHDRLEAMRPFLVVLDLSAAGPGVEELVAAGRRYGSRVIAFGPHVQKELLARAQRAGCDAVYTNARFKTQTDEILRQWAGDDAAD